MVTKNPVAKELRTPKYRSKVVKDKKKYDRKNITQQLRIMKC